MVIESLVPNIKLGPVNKPPNNPLSVFETNPLLISVLKCGCTFPCTSEKLGALTCDKPCTERFKSSKSVYLSPGFVISIDLIVTNKAPLSAAELKSKSFNDAP